MVSFLAGIAAAALAAEFEVRAGDTLGVLALARPPGPEVELVEATLALRQEASARRAGVLDAQQLRARMVGPSTASLEELDRAYGGARVAYLAGDHQGAVRALNAIVEELERMAESGPAFAQWERAVLRLAKAETDLGRPEAARALLDRLLRADPDAVVDRELYDARFAQQVDHVRAALRAEPTRTLRVEASSGQAQVYLNGRGVGVAPLTLQLPRGRYRLSGELPASRLLPQPIDLREADLAVRLDFAIPDALRPALGPGLALEAEERGRRVVAVGGYLGLDEVVTVSLEEEAGAHFLVGALHDVRRGMLVRDGRIRNGRGDAIAALTQFLLTGMLTSSLVEPLHPRWPPSLVPSPVLPGSPAQPARAPAAAAPPRVPTWITVGTAVGAVGLGAFAAWETRSASSSYAEARAIRAGGLDTFEAISQYNAAVVRGDAARRNATLAWVGAGVAALTGGVLAYLDHRAADAVGPSRP